jgi:hypothetical protein
MVSNDPDEPAAQVRHETHAGRDAFSSSRDMIIHQYQSLLREGAGLEDLSARSGAEFLAQLSSNEATFNDAAFLLARASVGKAAEVLKVLVAMDEGLAISLLARVNLARAQELADTIGSNASWLQSLPGAADSITQCEIGAGAALGRRVGRLVHASPSPQGAQGFWQEYENGTIHWSARGGAQAAPRVLAGYHSRLGGTGGSLGFPLAPAKHAKASTFGTAGICQRFEGASDYGAAACELLAMQCGGTVYWSNEFGAHATSGGIGEFYELNYGTAGPLGFPVSDEFEVGPSRQDAGDGTVGWCQRFEGGVVYFSDKAGAFAVPAPVADYLDSHGGVTGPTGFPVSQLIPLAVSPYETTGQLQRFEGATIYLSEAYGVYTVGWRNGELYERLGGPAGRLGLPRSDETKANPKVINARCTIQEFEGGSIFRDEEHGPVAVSREVLPYVDKRHGLHGVLGFPVSQEEALGAGGGSRIQFFEHGLVTIRDDIIEVWTRYPAVPHEPIEPISHGGRLVRVTMPQLGESVTEGTVTRWLKREGEHVEVDEPLLEVSTDKVDTEIPSPATGFLRGIVVDEDETVAVGAELAVIEEG